MFVGRVNELSEIEHWVADNHSRAGVLVGSAGCGKSELLKAFARRCTKRGTAQAKWYVQRTEITANQQPGEAMDGLLRQMYSAYNGYVRTGPDDHDRVRALLTTIPKVGGLLATFLNQDTRVGWKRFLDFVTVLSEATVTKHGASARLIFLVDPRDELQLDLPGDWIPLAEDLPDVVRLVVAQRPDDTLVTHGGASRLFVNVLKSPLGDLSEPDVSQWYAQELRYGCLQGFGASLHKTMWQTAYARYGGYPFAHDAAMKVLAHDKPKAGALLNAMTRMPDQMTGLLDELCHKLRALGEKPYRAALTLCLFGMPTPQTVWAHASNMDTVALSRLLDDRRFSCLFQQVETRFGKCFLPYHALFAERLERKLENKGVRDEIANAAWSTIAPRLDKEVLESCNSAFFELVAAVPVAAYLDERELLPAVAKHTYLCKVRLGLLEEAASDMYLLIEHLDENEQADLAATYGNLGNIMRIRGELDDAERMNYKVLGIEQNLGRRKSMANAYGNLGHIAQERGELDRAEQMYRQSIEINQEIDGQAGLANSYSGLGAIMRSRGDLDGAEKMLRNALGINKKLNRQDCVATNCDYLGLISQSHGQLDFAERWHEHALVINEKIGRREGIANNYANLGVLMANRGKTMQAQRLWEQSRDLFSELGIEPKAIMIQAWIDNLPSH